MPPLGSERIEHLPAASWSPSRSRFYRLCPRALFHSLHSPPSHSRSTPQLSPAETIGIAVHAAIGDHITRWSRGGKPTHSFILESGRARLDQIIQESSLTSTDLDKNEISAIRTRVELLLRRFARYIWPQYSNHQYVCHEVEWTIGLGGTLVVLRPDLVTQTPTHAYVVTDWKTYSRAQDRLDDEWVQFAAYVWATSVTQHVGVSSVEGRGVSVPSGEVRRVQGDPGMAVAIKSRITDEAARWMSEDIADFEARPGRKACETCRFVDFCPEGRAVLQKP